MLTATSARLFVAVWPPDEVVERVAALGRPPIAGLRWTDRRQWHVTLRFLGRADVAEARRALRNMVGPEAPVEAAIGPAVERFAQRVLQVPVSGLDGLAAATVSATADVGEPPDDRPFAGHLTLARAAKRAGVDLGRFTGEAITGTWPVTEVCLVESRLTPAGARYEVVERRTVKG